MRVSMQEISQTGQIKMADLVFTKPGMYEYLIREKPGDACGWRYDTREYPMVVTVTDDGKGQLHAAVAFPEGEPNFENVFDAKPVTVQIHAKVETIGKPLEPGMFTFALLDDKLNELARTENDADGTILFPPMELTIPGDYVFYMKQVTPDLDGWQLDEKLIPVHVHVDCSGAQEISVGSEIGGKDARLDANVEYPDGPPLFINEAEEDRPGEIPEPPEQPNPQPPSRPKPPSFPSFPNLPFAPGDLLVLLPLLLLISGQSSCDSCQTCQTCKNNQSKN